MCRQGMHGGLSVLGLALMLGHGAAGAQQLPAGYVKDPPVTTGMAPGMAVEEATAVTHTYTVRFTGGD
jgi:hypothetical protein